MTPSLRLLLASTALASVAAAQSDAPTVLSPFEVKSESGYQPTTALSVTRFAENLRNLPITLSALTEDFLKDFDPLDFNDAFRYVPGVEVAGRRADPDSTFILRGFGSSLFRDGVPTYRAPGFYNVQRVEVLKGPAAILFGQSDPGGIVNVLTKRAIIGGNQRTLTFGYGSWDAYRVQADINQTLVPRALAVRVNAYRSEGDHFADYMGLTEQFGAISLAARANDRLTFWFNAERRERDERGGVGNGLPLWLGADGRGGVSPLRQTGRPVGVHPSATAETNVYPNGYNKIENVVLNGSAELIVAPWLTLRSYTVYDQGKFLRADSLHNDNYLNPLVDPDTMILRQVLRENRYTEVFQTQVDAMTSFDFGAVKLRSITSFEYNTNLFQLTERRIRFNPSPAAYSDPGMIAGGTYNVRTGVRTGYMRPGLPVDRVLSLTIGQDGVNEVLTPFTGDLRPQISRGWVSSHLISAFEDRLHLLGALRYSDVAGNVANDRLYSADPQVGAIFKLRPNVSVFASYSETFRRASGSRDHFGNPLEPITGEGVEAGFKFDLLQQKLFATLSAFHILRQNLPVTDPDLFAGVAAPGGQRGLIQTGEQMSEGVELEMFYRPIRPLQTTVGFSYLHTETTKDKQRPFLVGQQLQGVPDYAVSFTARYDLSAAALKGLSLLGAVTGRYGARTIDNMAYTNGGYTTYDAGFIYGFRLGRFPATFQLNLRNLSDKFYLNGASSAPGAPRSFNSSLTLRF
jgi:iron complex outermembrane receptor protein